MLYSEDPELAFAGKRAAVFEARTVDAQIVDKSVQALVKTCAFSNRMVAPLFERIFHNEVVKICSDERYGAPTDETIVCVFEYLPLNERILDFFVALRCLRWSAEEDREDGLAIGSDLPVEFLQRSVVKYSTGRHKEPLRACDYHQHASDKERRECHRRGRIIKDLERLVLPNSSG